MVKSRVKRENYITIQGFMLTVIDKKVAEWAYEVEI